MLNVDRHEGKCMTIKEDTPRTEKGQFVKGHKAHPKAGRPKKITKSPQEMLAQALTSGKDISDLKEFALELLTDKEYKMTAAQVERILAKLFDVELELMKRDREYSTQEKDRRNKNRKSRAKGLESVPSEDESSEVVEFSTSSK